MAQHEIDTDPFQQTRHIPRRGRGVGIAALAAASPSPSSPSRVSPAKRSSPGSTSPRRMPYPMWLALSSSGRLLDSWITPNDQFFTVHHYPVPTIAADGWALKLTASSASRCRSRSPTCAPARARRSPSRWSAPATTASPGSPAPSATPLGPARRSRRSSRRRGSWIRDRSRLLRERQRRGGCPRHEGDRAVRAQHVGGGRDGPEPPALLRDERRAAAGDARRPGAADRAGLVRGRERQVAGAHPGAADALRGAVHGPRLCDDAHEQHGGDTVTRSRSWGTICSSRRPRRSCARTGSTGSSARHGGRRWRGGGERGRRGVAARDAR